MADLQRALLAQKQALHSISRTIPNLKKQGQSKIVPALLQRRKQQLAELMADVRMRDVEIQQRATDAEQTTLEYFTRNQFDCCEDTYNDVQDQLDLMLVSLAPVSNATVGADEKTADLEPKVKLPPLSLPNFDGSYTQWETFRDRFSSLVVNNKRLANVDKMNYLSSALSGKALSTIAHLAITDANFESAWTILRDNFDHRRRIVFAHVENLCDLPALTIGCPDSVRALRDTINGTLKALENLKCLDILGDLIIIVSTIKRMDTEARAEWERERGKSREIPSLQDLDQFLQTRIFTLEALAPSPREQIQKHTSAKFVTSSHKQISTHSTAVVKLICFVCKQAHFSYRCAKFKALDVNTRYQLVRRNNRCVNCLAANHHSDTCPSVHRCRICQQAHHTLLHRGSNLLVEPATVSPSNTTTDIVSHYATNATVPARSYVLLATAHVKVHSMNGRTAIVRALLDQGSEATLIGENLAQLLHLTKTAQATRVLGIGDTRTVAKHVARIDLGPISQDSPLLSTTAIVLKSVTKFAPRHRATSSSWPHVSDLPFADRDPFSTEPIQLIIGADLYGSVLTEGLRKGGPNEPTAQNTIFGWILSGPLQSADLPASVSTHAVSLETVDAALRRFWEIEDVPASTTLTPEEQRCELHFAQTHTRATTGRYIVRLPFTADRRPTFGNSRDIALAQFRRLEGRLHRNPQLAHEYGEFLKEYEDLGHMEEIDMNASPSSTAQYYIPHHAVRRETSSTTRLRVVFNASAKNHGASLNDHLLHGPKLQTDLTAILLRWRKFRYVLTADIAKMYRQITMHPDDADYQRILWRSSPAEPIRDYRLLTVTYGTASAPFLALRVLDQLALDEGHRFPLAVPVLRNQTYVDDLIFGDHDSTGAIDTRDQAIALLARGGFHPRKWASNSAELLVGIDAADHGLASKDLRADDTLKVLGVSWHPTQDAFKIKFDCSGPSVATKRALLSTIARMFDPFGWIAPVLVSAKILMQNLWQTKCGWDDPLPTEILNEWSRLYSQLSLLESISIPRWIACYDNIHPVQLHGFADASVKAYAAVIYIRVENPNKPVVTALLIAKSKVAPVNTISVPRLELCAALLLARLLKYTREMLQLPTSECYCWSDSSVALEWISQSPSRWETFVANRVAKIQALGADVAWRHVPTQDNPADCASRGISPPALVSHELWWSGPPWLTAPSSSWPPAPSSPKTEIAETRSLHASHADAREEKWDLEQRFSSWNKLLRVTAYILRFVSRVRGRPGQRTHIWLQPSELLAAKKFWITQIQRASFPSEFQSLAASGTVQKSSALSALSPFVDKEGVLRVRGRLRRASVADATKYPVILKSHPLVLLMIADLHKELLHGGPHLIIAHLRQNYWLLRARQLIRLVLYRCIPCTRENARTGVQLMGDLPDCRVTPTARPFVHTGVDYAGPILVKVVPGRGHKTTKAYIAVFICMTTKAMHLELVSNYSTSAFLAAYHRFVSRRGLPSHMYSDNGTNFRGADRELQTSYQAAIHDPSIVSFAADRGVSWHYIPPSAPHFGGLWEAAVRSVKFHLRRFIGSYTLSFEEMTTLLCRIEACLNSRPLTAFTDSLDDYQCLTPGHFLIGTPLVAPPEPSTLDLPENRLSRWELIQRITDNVWQAWKRDYLLTLQQRPKWRERQTLARIGQIVLIKDDASPPSHWSMGRITECHPGSDGLTRVVTIRTSTTILKRPIAKLCFLPIDINNAIAEPPGMAGGVQQ